MNPLIGYWYKLHANPTAPELAIEPAIAALGHPYRAQHLFMGLSHIADFAIPSLKLTIEVDGDSHEKPAQREKDLIHTIKLTEMGWRVARVSNEEALSDPEGAIARALSPAAMSEVPTVPELKERLAQLHRDFPRLLEPRAKRSRSKRPPGKAAGKPHRTRAARLPSPS